MEQCTDCITHWEFFGTLSAGVVFLWALAFALDLREDFKRDRMIREYMRSVARARAKSAAGNRED